MANVVNDAVDLMRRVGSGVKRNLVRSNGGMGTIQSKRVAKLHDLESSIYKGMKEKTGEELADFLDNHRPSNYRVGKNYKTWQGMTEKSKKAAITGDLQIRSRNADRVTDAIRTANHTEAGTKETFNLLRNAYAGSNPNMRATVGSSVKAAGLMAQDYYTSGNFAQTATRVGVTAGAYMVGASGARYLSGGSMDYNSKGERDIVGVPFV